MTRRQFYQRAWFKCLAGLVIVLILVPIILRPVLVRVLVDNGFQQAAIENISINWFTGVVAVEKVTLNREDKHKLSLGLLRVDFDWLALFDGELLASFAEISDVKFSVIQQENGWDIVAPIAVGNTQNNAEPAEPMNLPKLGLTELVLRNIEIEVNTDYAAGDLAIETLTLQRLSSWQDYIANLNLVATWDGAPILVDVAARPLHTNPELKADIRIDGIDLSAISRALPSDISDFGARLNVDIAVNVERDSNGVLAADLNGDVALADLGLKYRHLALSTAAIDWAGALAIEMQPQTPSYQLTGDVALKQLSLLDHQQTMALASFDSLQLKALSVDPTVVSFQQLLLTELAAIKAPQAAHHWLRQKQLQLEQFDYQHGAPQPALSLASIIAKEGDYYFAVNKQGGLEGQAALDAAFAPLLDSAEENKGESTESPSDTPPENPSLLLRLDQLRLEKTAIAFQDGNFKKPYSNELHIDQLSLSQLDQSKPEQLSPLQIQARLGEFSTINFSGELAPFADQLALTLAGKISSLPLPEISPYAEAYLGYQLVNGQYDHDIKLQLDNNVLDMKNNLKLRRLKLKPVDKNSAEKISKGLDMPLPLALSMLRDRNDVIDLDIPLKGDLDNFNLGVSDIIQTALVKALQHGSMSYLQLALQPYGAAIFAADLLVGQLGTIRFEPVRFEPGSLALAPQTAPYLEKLQGMLDARKGLSLNLCGRSSTADQQKISSEQASIAANELNAQLMKLADDRAKTLKRQLVDAGIQGDRLYLCKPAFDENAVAGVMLTM